MNKNLMIVEIVDGDTGLFVKKMDLNEESFAGEVVLSFLKENYNEEMIGECGEGEDSLKFWLNECVENSSEENRGTFERGVELFKGLVGDGKVLKEFWVSDCEYCFSCVWLVEGKVEEEIEIEVEFD